MNYTIHLEIVTKQDKKYQVRVGPIKFYGGYQSNPVKKSIYPPERLCAFLNVNANKFMEVKEFCNTYVFLPPRLYSLGLKQAFKEEQNKLLTVYRNYKNHGELNKEDLIMINSYLELTKPKILKTTRSDIEKYNQYLGGETNTNKGGNSHLIKVFKTNAVSTLWEDFVNQVINSQKLSECLKCGKFYIKTSKHKRLFCSPECADAHRKKVKRQS